MTDPRLARDIAIYNDVKQRIKAAFDLDDEDQSLLDTVEGETSLHELLASILREVRRSEAFSEAIKGLAKDLADRKARLDQRSFKLRQAVTWAMQEAGLGKLPLPDMTVSLSAGRAPLVINDESAVPDEFCRTKKEPDKTKIREAIEESGEALPFAYLGNKVPTLTIRGK